MEWWRSWHGAPTDPKWLLIARRAKVAPGMVSAIAWALFDYASQAKERGSIAGFDVETYAAFSEFDESEISAVLKAMRSKDIISADNKLTAWDKRQPKREDNSTPRVQGYRERHRNAEQRSETQDAASPLPPLDSPIPQEKDTDSEENRAEQSRTEEYRTVTQSNAAKRKGTQAAAATTAAAVKVFENTIGLLPGGTVREEIVQIIDDLDGIGHPEWWQQALDEAVTHNARSWAYVRSILTRCISEGKAPASGYGGRNGSKSEGKEHPAILAMRAVRERQAREEAEYGDQTGV